jgi:hypothetical protein
MSIGRINANASARVRARQSMGRSASQAIRSLKKTSDEVVSGGLLANAQGAASDVLAAVWNMIMNILRAIARLFGRKFEPPMAGHGADLTGDEGVDSAAVANAVERSSVQALDLISDAVAEATPEGDAFLAALQYAGVDDLNKALLSAARSPSELIKFSNPVQVMEAILKSAGSALAVIDASIDQNRVDRSSLGEQVKLEMGTPNLFLDDAITILRKADRSGLPAAGEKLLEIDNSMKKALAHRETIQCTMSLMLASAEKQGIEIEASDASIKACLGTGWRAGVDQFLKALDIDATQPSEKVRDGEGSEESPSPESESDDAATQVAMQFMARIRAPTPAPAAKAVARISAADRLRAAAAASLPD